MAPCNCSASDLECEFGFERVNGSCVAMAGLESNLCPVRERGGSHSPAASCCAAPFHVIGSRGLGARSPLAAPLGWLCLGPTCTAPPTFKPPPKFHPGPQTLSNGAYKASTTNARLVHADVCVGLDAVISDTDGKGNWGGGGA